MKRGGEGIGWTVALEIAPAGLFGAAVGFCAATLMGLALFDPLVVSAGAGGFALAWLTLRLFRGSAPQFPMRYFEQAPIEPEELVEPEDLVRPAPQPQVAAAMEEPAELLLDDPLPAPEADSRVVRLFDPARMPTAGELQSRIERHLRSSERQAPDATEELHAALAALRHSLR